MSQPPNPGLSLGKGDWEASKHSGFAAQEDQRLKIEIHVNVFIPSNRMIQSQNLTLFRNNWPLTLIFPCQHNTFTAIIHEMITEIQRIFFPCVSLTHVSEGSFQFKCF